MTAPEPAVDPEQCATVLEQIADHSSDDDLRAHIRQVARALRGNGLIFLNGPPQERLRQEHRPGPVVGYLTGDGKTWHPSDVTIVRAET